MWPDTCMVIFSLCTIAFACVLGVGGQQGWRSDVLLDRRSKRWASPWKSKGYPHQLENRTPNQRFKRWISTRRSNDQFQQPSLVHRSMSPVHQHTSGFHNQGTIMPWLFWLQKNTLASQQVRWNPSWPVSIRTTAGSRQVGLPALRATFWFKQKNEDHFNKHQCHFVRNPNFRLET